MSVGIINYYNKICEMTYSSVVILLSISVIFAQTSIPYEHKMTEVEDLGTGFMNLLRPRSGLVQSDDNFVYILGKVLSATDSYIFKKAPIASTGTFTNVFLKRLII